MTNKLQQYFPMLRTREEILHEIEHRPNLRHAFYNWSEKAQNEFLDFTTGAKGVKMMYDFASKELLNPETHLERVNEAPATPLTFYFVSTNGFNRKTV